MITVNRQIHSPMENQILTVKEALAAGYTNCIYDSDGYQALKDIAELEPSDFREDKYLVVCETNGISPTIDEDDLKALVRDHINDNWECETGDDTNEVYDILDSIDYSEIAKTINEKLQAKSYCAGTDIRLIP